MDFQMKSLVKAPLKPVLNVYLEYKVICGDESDNIPAIDNKIGKVTAAKLATNPDMLAKRLMSPEVKANYERNHTLINLTRIPQDIQDGIMELV
jgi:5'-3' exonuclease